MISYTFNKGFITIISHSIFKSFIPNISYTFKKRYIPMSSEPFFNDLLIGLPILYKNDLFQ